MARAARGPRRGVPRPPDRLRRHPRGRPRGPGQQRRRCPVCRGAPRGRRFRLRCAAGRLAVGHRRRGVVAGRWGAGRRPPTATGRRRWPTPTSWSTGCSGSADGPACPTRRWPGSTRSPTTPTSSASTCRRGRTRPGEVGRGRGVFADETVTFGVAKPVHLLPATEPAVGRLTVIDIGLDVERRAPTSSGSTSPTSRGCGRCPDRSDDKYSRGVLGVVAGGEDYTGAAVLCCTAAVGAGLGMLRYVGTPTPTGLVRAAVPEAVIGDGPGAGLGGRPRTRHRPRGPRAARPSSTSPVPRSPPTCRCWSTPAASTSSTGRRDGPTLLTPHAGELARLLTRLEGCGEADAAPTQVAGRPASATRRRARRPDRGDGPAQGRHHPRRPAHRRGAGRALAERRAAVAGHGRCG